MVSSFHEIPGYSDAVKSEQLDRSAAFAGIPERLCGLPVEQLTPFLFEFATASGSPFTSSGRITDAAILHFLWIINPRFNSAIPKLGWDEFFEANTELNFDQASRGIEDYLERTFLDSTHEGSKDDPICASTASLLTQLQGPPFNWSYTRVMTTPYRISLQLLKSHVRHQGGIVINKRSTKVRLEYFQSLEFIKSLNAAKEAKKEAECPANTTP